MIVYLTLRFEYKLALPALLSVVHDVWLALAIYSIAGKEVTGATVAALLTILGYSLYDVVIVFDRIRENVPLMQGRPYRDIVNRSVHETLTRSIITMVLTLLPITVLLIFGGETLRDFSFALLRRNPVRWCLVHLHLGADGGALEGARTRRQAARARSGREGRAGGDGRRGHHGRQRARPRREGARALLRGRGRRARRDRGRGGWGDGKATG